MDGFDTLVKNVLLDENENRTAIRLKLKTLNFITYVWQERNINGLCRDCDNNSINREAVSKGLVLENICKFFSFEDRLYLERSDPFEEKDSLQWIEQVINMLDAFKVPCETFWKEGEKSLMMVKWIRDSHKFVESQINDEEDEDVKEMYLNLQSKIRNLLLIKSVFGETGKIGKTKEEL